MPEYIETLQTYIKFYPNIDSEYVPIEAPPANEGLYRTMVNAAGGYLFTKGDNIRVISCGYILPDFFTHYTDDTAVGSPSASPRFAIVMKNANNAVITYPRELSGNTSAVGFAGGMFYVPYDGEYFFNAYMNPYDTSLAQGVALTDFSILGWLHDLRITMRNCPDGYDDIAQKIRLFIKVAHTIKLETIPE